MIRDQLNKEQNDCNRPIYHQQNPINSSQNGHQILRIFIAWLLLCFKTASAFAAELDHFLVDFAAARTQYFLHSAAMPAELAVLLNLFSAYDAVLLERQGDALFATPAGSARHELYCQRAVAFPKPEATISISRPGFWLLFGF